VTKVKVEKAGQALVPNTEFAKMLGVSTRTLWTWADEGILPAPTVIRGRKYWDPAVRPKAEATPA
jgi:hypothetical protein